jgi:hypothetical protein
VKGSMLHSHRMGGGAVIEGKHAHSQRSRGHARRFQKGAHLPLRKKRKVGEGKPAA